MAAVAALLCFALDAILVALGVHPAGFDLVTFLLLLGLGFVALHLLLGHWPMRR